MGNSQGRTARNAVECLDYVCSKPAFRFIVQRGCSHHALEGVPNGRSRKSGSVTIESRGGDAVEIRQALTCSEAGPTAIDERKYGDRAKIPDRGRKMRLLDGTHNTLQGRFGPSAGCFRMVADVYDQVSQVIWHCHEVKPANAMRGPQRYGGAYLLRFDAKEEG